MVEDCRTTSRRKLSTRQRLAVWERCAGRCVCGRKVQVAERWQADHPRALGLSGPDDPDLLVVLGPCCTASKNAADIHAIARAKRMKARHVGAYRSKRPFRGWRRFNGERVWRADQ
jgi:5-methylcytosine-specific restriction protein A